MIVLFGYGKRQGAIMNQKQIQTRALEYIKDRVENQLAEVNASINGVDQIEIETFMGWFVTFEDFKEWALENWGQDEYMHLQEIYACIGGFLRR
jgi:hypothetical protein